MSKSLARRDHAHANPDSNVIRALTAQHAELRRRHREEIDELHAALAAAHGENLELRRKLGRPSG